MPSQNEDQFKFILQLLYYQNVCLKSLSQTHPCPLWISHLHSCPPTSFGIAEDVGNPSQDQKPFIVKLDLTQSGHSKAVLRKELKKDVQMNAVFQEIHVDFYLLAITENLFIENSVCFNP